MLKAPFLALMLAASPQVLLAQEPEGSDIRLAQGTGYLTVVAQLEAAGYELIGRRMVGANEVELTARNFNHIRRLNVDYESGQIFGDTLVREFSEDESARLAAGEDVGGEERVDDMSGAPSSDEEGDGESGDGGGEDDDDQGEDDASVSVDVNANADGDVKVDANVDAQD